jgi:uncharacterized protein YwgA
MGDLVQVISGYGFRTEVSHHSLMQLYGPRYSDRLTTAIRSLIDGGKIVEFTREDAIWYKVVK